MPAGRRIVVLAVAVATAGMAGCRASSATAPTDLVEPTDTTTVTPTTAPPPTTVVRTTTTAGTTPLAGTTTTTPTTLLPRPAPPDEVVPFEDGDSLAEALAAAEAALADPTTPPDEHPRWAWLQQQAYRDLVTHPEWQPAARDQVPARLREAFDLNLRAGTLLRELTSPQPGLPDWTVIPPPPVDELRTHYEDAEAEFGVPWNVLAAIHLVETRFGRIQGDSPAGAQGPMQFLPDTWDAYGEGDINDPGDAIRAAARYLVAHGAPDDLSRALFAYNHSDLYVEAVLAHAAAMARYDHYLAVYHQWRVYFRTVDGDVLLDQGYGS